MLRDHPYYGAAEVRAYGLAVWKTAMEAAAQNADGRAEQVRAANTYRGRISAASTLAVDQLEFLASVLRSLPEPVVTQHERTGE